MNLHDVLIELAAGAPPADTRVLRNALWARVGSTLRTSPPTRSVAVPVPRTDVQLLDGLRHGEAAAFDAIVHRYAGPMKGWASRQVGHAAEDLTQEALLALYSQRTRLTAGVQLRGWLFRTLRHKVIDHQRRLATRAAASLTRPDGSDLEIPDPVDLRALLETRDGLKHVARALEATCDALTQEIVALRLRGDTAREIGEELGLSRVAVAKRLQRTLPDVRTWLEQNP